MSRKYFGTDGVRGVANDTLTPELALSLGRAAGAWVRAQGWAPRAVIGRDTRRSGPMLGAAFASGLCSAGVDVTVLGVVPTPAVSYVVRKGGFGLGMVVSASHNPAPDNGIKLFGNDGRKLADEAEELIEDLISDGATERPSGDKVGWMEPNPDGVSDYRRFLVSLVPERLDGLRVAMDLANGAACEIAPQVFAELGAEITAIGASPDGMNINDACGATRPEAIQRLTVESGAAAGIAFDGDADRVVFTDAEGRLFNGDRLMGIWCSHWKRFGELRPAVAVGTVMTNSGLEAYLTGQGIALERTSVGDKYVSERLLATGAKIGGEQSGHIIFPEVGPTGDGLATALQLLRVLRREGKALADFWGDYEPWPQIMINVQVSPKEGWTEAPRVRESLEWAKSRLDGAGRVVVRASGTQPMVRVMVEAQAKDVRDEVAEGIVEALRLELGGTVYSRVDLTYALGD